MLLETLYEWVLLGLLLLLAVIIWLILILAALRFISFVLALLLSPMTKRNKIAVINVHGMITSLNEPRRPSPGVTFDGISKLINKSVQQGVKGIIFDVDSSGGQVPASFKIAKRIAGIKIPTIAVIKDTGASGAYLIASACSKVIADEWSSVGSIGVIMPLIEGEELLKKIGIGYYPELKAGKYKDMGVPYRRLVDEEVEILKKDLDESYKSFIEFVAKHRGMDEERVKQLATGKTYIGRIALENGLIDMIGDRKTAREEMKRLTGKSKIREVRYSPKPRTSIIQNIIDNLTMRSGRNIAKGFREEINSELKSNKKMEL
ncbi:MAG: signal peptide peptidase SppA [Candidatus Hodarchaeales archaeon]|jgi:protease-4